MPYVVKRGSGSKPYKIVNQKTGEVVGSSASLTNAHRSIGYREDAEGIQRSVTSKDFRQYKKKVDNKMHGYGETDLVKKTIRINKSKSKNGSGEILDTIVHEKSHILHPKMHEKNIRKHTARVIKKMSPKEKRKHYNMFKT